MSASSAVIRVIKLFAEVNRGEEKRRRRQQETNGWWRERERVSGRGRGSDRAARETRTRLMVTTLMESIPRATLKWNTTSLCWCDIAGTSRTLHFTYFKLWEMTGGWENGWNGAALNFGTHKIAHLFFFIKTTLRKRFNFEYLIYRSSKTINFSRNFNREL